MSSNRSMRTSSANRNYLRAWPGGSRKAAWRCNQPSRYLTGIENLESRLVLSGMGLTNGNAVPDDMVLADSDSYLVVSQARRLPKGLANKLESSYTNVVRELAPIGIVEVETWDSCFEETVSSIKGVRSIIPNVELDWIRETSNITTIENGPDAVINPPNADDDPFFAIQWNLDAVNAPEAWDLGARGKGARVAVLDAGVDLNHPDLAPNLNVALSTTFVPGEPVQYDPVIGGGTFSHGTHVAGIVGAADNAFGVIGVAPEVELMHVKVLSDSGSGGLGGIMAGILYAADQDADVINMSLSGKFTRDGYVVNDVSDPTDDVFLGAKVISELAVAMGRATTYAFQQGTTVISSAGNDAADLNHTNNLIVLPAQSPHVIAVSATKPVGWAIDQSTDLDLPASYTNTGTSAIEFAAPGGDLDRDLLTSVCGVGPVFSLCGVFDLVPSTSFQGFAWSGGTSMAAPHVAGVAALIIGENGGDMHPSQVRGELRSSADDLGKPGKDDFYGHGRVNAESIFD